MDIKTVIVDEGEEYGYYAYTVLDGYRERNTYGNGATSTEAIDNLIKGIEKEIEVLNLYIENAKKAR